MKARATFRNGLLAIGLLIAIGCSADSPSSPTAPPVNPVPPAPPSATLVLTITPATSTLEVNSTDFTTLTIRATRGGVPLSGVVNGTVTTTLGNIGSVGGPQTQAIELVNGQATIVVFPGSALGTASVRAEVNGSLAFATIVIVEEGTPDTFFLSSVSPSSGSPQGGDVITINGGGFSDPIRVTIGGIPAVIQSASGSQIRVTTPRCSVSTCFDTGAITPVAVSVTVNLNEEGQASDSLTPGFTYINGGGGGGTLQPTVFSVTPSSGPNEGGTQVTINGDGFEAPVAVEFGDVGNEITAQVISVTRTRIVVLSPAATGIGAPNLNELVDIRVTNQSSGRTHRAVSAFRYGVEVSITSIAPGEGPATGGTLVTIFGRGFDEPVAVTMGGRAQQVISVSGSEIVVRTVGIQVTNCADVTGPTTVVNIESGDSATGPSFTYRVPRVSIFSVSPFGGPQSGNTVVTITGANFGSPMIVDFVIGGTAFTGNVQSSTSSTISVRSPAIPNAALDTQTCDDNGNPIPPDPTPDPDGERYLAVTANVRITDPQTGCTATLNGVFTFSPTDSTCRGD